MLDHRSGTLAGKTFGILIKTAMTAMMLDTDKPTVLNTGMMLGNDVLDCGF